MIPPNPRAKPRLGRPHCFYGRRLWAAGHGGPGAKPGSYIKANLPIAKAFGLTIPQLVLLRARDVIE